MNSVTRPKKKLTRGEKWLLVAPLFVLAAVFGVTWFRNKTKPITPYLTIEAPPKTIFTNVTLSPDGKYVVAAGGDQRTISPGNGKLHVYDARSGMLIVSKVIGEDWMITGLAISPDSRLLASGSEDTMIWNLQTDTLHRKLTRGKDFYGRDIPVGAGSLAFSPDNRVLVVGGGSNVGVGRASLWDVQTGILLRHIDRSNNSFKPNQENFLHKFPRYSPDGKMLACIAEGGLIPAVRKNRTFDPTKNTDNRVQIWDVATGKLLRVIPQKNILSFAFSQDGKNIATSCYTADPLYRPGKAVRPQVRLYNLQTGSLLWFAENKFEFAKKTFLLRDDGITFAPDGKTLACQDQLGRIRFYNSQSGQLLRVIELPLTNGFAMGGPPNSTSPPALTYSQDGKTLLSRRGNSIYLWHTDDWNIQ